MINLTRGVPSRFHHIRLNKQFQRDVTMWKVFLTQWNGRFLDSFVTTSPVLELYNFLVRARHVPGVNNGIADALSRFQVKRFRDLAPTADRTPCFIPPSLMTL